MATRIEEINDSSKLSHDEIIELEKAVSELSAYAPSIKTNQDKLKKIEAAVIASLFHLEGLERPNRENIAPVCKMLRDAMR